eukprot:g15659.t1
MSKKKHLVRVLRSEEEAEETRNRNIGIPLREESQPNRTPTTAATADKTGGITTPSLPSSSNADHGSVSDTSANQTSGGRPGRIPKTSSAGVRGKTGAAGRVSAVARRRAGSAAVGDLQSPDGGIECAETSSTDHAMTRKGHALGALGGGGARAKETATSSRVQMITTSANSLALQGTEGYIQEMVNTIKSRNTNNGGGRQAKGGPWTLEEDEALRGIVGRDGEGNWREKSEKLNEAMGSRYRAMTTAAIAKGEAPVEYGRVAAQCLHRWKKVLRPGLNKGHWTEKEDALVQREVAKAEAEGTILKWSEVASLLPGRLGKQCRERWFNHLDPSVKKTAWTPREDEILFNAQEFFGTRWCEISKFLPGRTENAVKNRYNSSAREKWAKSRPKAGGGAEKKKAAPRAFIDRLRSTLKMAPRGRLDEKRPPPPATHVGATSASLPFPPSKPMKRVKLSVGLGAPSRKQSKLKQNHLGATLVAGAMKPFKIKRGGATAASTNRGGGGGAVPTHEKKPAVSPRPSVPPAKTTGSSEGKKLLQSKQAPAQTAQEHKHRNGSAAPNLTTTTSCSSDIPQTGSVVGGAVRESGSTARQNKKTTKTLVPRGDKEPLSPVLPPSKRKKSTAQPEGKEREPATPESPGTRARLPPHQAGVKRQGIGRAGNKIVAISAGGAISVVEGSKGTVDQCRPKVIQEKRVLPACDVSDRGRTDRQPDNNAGPGASTMAAHTGGGGGSERVSATWEQRALAAADAAAKKADAAVRYMRGQWTLPQPEATLAPSLSNSEPIAQPHRHLEIGPSDKSMYSPPPSITSAAVVSSTVSTSAASILRTSDRDSLLDVGTVPTASIFTAAGAKGAGLGAAVAGTLITQQTPSTHSILTASGGTRKSNTGSKSFASLFASSNTNKNNPNGNGITSNSNSNSNSITSNSTSTSNITSTSSHFSSAESFVSAFLADGVRAPPLPFAPPEAWRMSSSVNLGQSSRTSSAASMMMMMMFGVGVGAGVSTTDEEEPPLLGGGDGHGGGAGDGRDLAASVAAATAAILRTPQAISSGGGGGSSVGAGGGSGSASRTPDTAALPNALRATGEAAGSTPGRVDNPALIEHGQHGRGPEQPAPVQIQGQVGGVPAGEHPAQRMAPSPVPCASLSPASSMRSSSTPYLALPATWAEAAGTFGPQAKPSGNIIGGGGGGGSVGVGGASGLGIVVPRDDAHGRGRDSDCNSGSVGGGGGDAGLVYGTGLPLQEEKSMQRFSGAVVPSEADAGSNGRDLRGFPGASSPITGPTTGSIVQDCTKNAARCTSVGGGGGGRSSSSSLPCDQVHDAEGGLGSAVSPNDEAGQHQQQLQTRSAIIGGE